MIDIIAAAAVILASLLALIGAVGLVRLPDVFTRMHAATKTATLGVILTTLAAALEVDTFGTVALLLLVAAFLFLSAPLGASLLARAAYHDPTTPRLLPDRDDLVGVDPAESSAATDKPGAPGLLAGWLVVVWIALFASATPGVFAGALGVAAVVALGLPGYRPRWPEGIFKPIAAMRFAFVFTRTLVSANLDVAAAVLSRRRLRPAIVSVPLRLATRTEVTLFMNVVTFTPGTVAVEVHGGDLYVHVLDLRDEAAFRSELAKLESAIIAAFGTEGERTRSR